MGKKSFVPNFFLTLREKQVLFLKKKKSTVLLFSNLFYRFSFAVKIFVTTILFLSVFKMNLIYKQNWIPPTKQHVKVQQPKY